MRKSLIPKAMNIDDSQNGITSESSGITNSPLIHAVSG